MTTTSRPADPESWKPIAGFADIYEISDHGRVRSMERVINAGGAGRGQTTRRVNERILKPSRGIRGPAAGQPVS
jgi:hypothetical protein